MSYSIVYVWVCKQKPKHTLTFLAEAAIRASSSWVQPRASIRACTPLTTSPSCTTSWGRRLQANGPTRSLLMSRRGTELRTAPAKLAKGSTCREKNEQQFIVSWKASQWSNELYTRVHYLNIIIKIIIIIMTYFMRHLFTDFSAKVPRQYQTFRQPPSMRKQSLIQLLELTYIFTLTIFF